MLALLPFPSVLSMMAQDPAWTQQLGDAVLAQRPDVMDAVQRMRRQSYDYGYLRSNPYCYVTNSDGYIEIQPVNPAYIYVPTYDPLLVSGPPRPGFAIEGAIRFGPAVIIGGAFAPWGWLHPHFLWGGHAIVFDDTPWNRVWINRGFYVHPYAHPWRRGAGPALSVMNSTVVREGFSTVQRSSSTCLVGSATRGETKMSAQNSAGLQLTRVVLW